MIETQKRRFTELPELYQRILTAIPSGSNKAISISYLMDKLAIKPSERRRVNHIINRLIFEYGYPIGTSSDENTRGIFMIENKNDLSLACHTLNSRAMSNLKRHKQLIKNFVAEKGEV